MQVKDGICILSGTLLVSRHSRAVFRILFNGGQKCIFRNEGRTKQK